MRFFHIRGKNRNEEKKSLGIGKSNQDLTFVKRLVLDASLITGNTLDCNQTLSVVQESCVGWRIGEEEPDNDSPQAGRATKLRKLLKDRDSA